MNRYRFLSLIFFVLGIVFFAVGILLGEVKTGFVLVFPFLVGNGMYAFLGFIFVFLGFLLFIYGFIKSVSAGVDLRFDGEDRKMYPRKQESSVIKSGGVVLIGPIPIVFGSNWKIAVVLMILAVIIIVTSFFVFRVF